MLIRSANASSMICSKPRQNWPKPGANCCGIKPSHQPFAANQRNPRGDDRISTRLEIFNFISNSPDRSQPMGVMKSLAVYAGRVQQQIDALAAISEAPAPVVTRILFSEADLQGRAFVKNLCREMGLSLREDAIGNLFARWQGGAEAELGAVATGSH